VPKRQNTRKAIIIIAFLLFPVVIFYFSPYLIVLGAIEGVAAGSFIMFGLQFVLSLFFGRAPCGYACPVGGLQECLALAQNKKVKGGRRDSIKYCLWAPWIAAIAVLFARSGGIKEVDFFYHTVYGVSLYEPFTYMIYYAVILLVAALSLTMGKRAFCHYVCWMAPFMIIGAKLAGLLSIPRLRLKAERDACIGCNRCSQQCPMSLDVQGMVANEDTRNAECILCGGCIDICPKNAIKYSFRK